MDALEGEDKEKIKATRWSREEKWSLVWATEYARRKFPKRAQSSKEWKRIFDSLCPDKKNIERSKLTTQKANFLREGIFKEEDLSRMRSEIEEMVEEQRCPSQTQFHHQG